MAVWGQDTLAPGNFLRDVVTETEGVNSCFLPTVAVSP